MRYCWYCRDWLESCIFSHVVSLPHLNDGPIVIEVRGGCRRRRGRGPVLVVSVGESEDSPVPRLEELAGLQVGVDSEQSAVSVLHQGGAVEVVDCRHQLSLRQREAGHQGQEEED